MSTRVLLADDHKLLRQGLLSLLEDEFDIEVVGEADNGRTTVQLARELSPHIVVMDIAMPDLNGIEATRQVVAEAPGVKVIALSIHSDRRFVIEMLQAGASGYLLKDCAFEELVRAVRAVDADKLYLSPDVAGLVVEDYVRHLEESHSALPDLTPRQSEVLQLLVEGKSIKEIAAALHVTVKTVHTHRRHLMKKLDIHSIAELTKYAIRAGLTPLEP